MKLPNRIKLLQQRVESLAGESVKWIQSNTIKGDMSASLDQGTPVIQYKNFSEGGAAEELMHLELILSGMPELSCPNNLAQSLQIAEMLLNTLHHHIILPELESMGYHPRRKQCTGILRQIRTVENTLDFSRISSEADLEASLAMLYTRGILECCNDLVIKRLEDLFSRDEFIQARKMGRDIIEIVTKHDGRDPVKCRLVLKKALAVLKQTQIIITS